VHLRPSMTHLVPHVRRCRCEHHGHHAHRCHRAAHGNETGVYLWNAISVVTWSVCATWIVSWKASDDEVGSATEIELVSLSVLWQVMKLLGAHVVVVLRLVELSQVALLLEGRSILEEASAVLGLAQDTVAAQVLQDSLASSLGILEVHPVLAQLAVATPLQPVVGATVAFAVARRLALGTVGMQLADLPPPVEPCSRMRLAVVQDSHSHRVGHLDTLGYLWHGLCFLRLTLHMKGHP